MTIGLEFIERAKDITKGLILNKKLSDVGYNSRQNKQAKQRQITMNLQSKDFPNNETKKSNECSNEPSLQLPIHGEAVPPAPSMCDAPSVVAPSTCNALSV